jgi:long-chain acyl-CoA synthetase
MPFITRPTLTKTFLDRVTLTPERVGVQFKERGAWRRLTFREYYNYCRSVSCGLIALGVKAGDRVAIVAATRYEWALADLSIQGTRAVTVPVYPSSTPQECQYIVDHSGSAVAIVENDLQAMKLLEAKPAALTKLVLIEATSATSDVSKKAATLGSVKLLSLDELRAMGAELEQKEPGLFEKNLEAVKPEDLFTICYTSGTTGTPKGVMLTHENLMSVLEDCVDVFGPYLKPEKEIVLSFLPLSHILARVESLAIHVFGWRQAFSQGLDQLMEDFGDVRPTLVFAVPRLFEKAYARLHENLDQASKAKRHLFDWAIQSGRAYNAPRSQGKSPSIFSSIPNSLARQAVFRKVVSRFGGRLKFAVCGGAPLPKEIGEFFQAMGIDVLEGYGLTETSAPVALNTPAQPRFGSVGRPLPEVSVRIADDGEILLKSKKVFQGYYRSPEDTAEAIQDGWFHTGDIGFLDEEGFLHITDRKKDIIVTSAGKNIAPQKIEALAKSHPMLSQLLVHGDRRNYLTALITLNVEEATRYAGDHQILFTEFKDLARHPRMIARVQKTIDEINQSLASFETIKKFMILPEDFTVEAGTLTPSLKVRRKIVEKKYQAELDQLYTANGG